MSETIKIVHVFIGSPGGLDEERRSAHEVVNNINRSHSDHWGIQLKLMGWEDVVPGYARPQSKINQDLDRCGYFIGVLWDRWGTPTSNDKNGYTSGFHEEFSRAEERVQAGHMKDMVVFFKRIEIPKGLEPGPDIKKVLEFKQKCIEEKRQLFKEFTDTNEFKDVVRAKLEEIGWNEAEKFVTSADDKIQVEQASAEVNNQNEINTTANAGLPETQSLFEAEAKRFVSNILNHSSELEDTKPQEIARFRLIASSIFRSGNDDSPIGNHDANLIFRYYRNSILTQREYLSLIDCGISGFHSQNVPLWRWLEKYKNKDGLFNRVDTLSIFGNNSERKSAINILTQSEQKIPAQKTLGMEFTLNLWLSDKTDNQVFDSAVLFLSKNAQVEDIQSLEKILLTVLPHRGLKIESAIIGILSKNSPNQALQRLIEKGVDSVPLHVTENLFKSPETLSTEVLLTCLSAKPDHIRIRALNILIQRDEIGRGTAKELLTDSNHEIRLLSAERLNSLDEPLEDEIARKVLTVVRRPNLSRLNFLFQQQETETKFYDIYNLRRISELDFDELKSKVEQKGIFADLYILALYTLYAPKMQVEIRANLQTGFQNLFDQEAKKISSETINGDQLRSKIKDLEKFLRDRLCTIALISLCSLSKAEDIELVRKTIDLYEIGCAKIIVNYISRFGDWSDIERIKRLGNYRLGLIDIIEDENYNINAIKANALISLGKNRISDLLSYDFEILLKRSLAKQLNKAIISSLTDEIILREISSVDDEYRIIFALRCILSLNKARLISLLNRYVDSDEPRYYNSVHWLDLGASFPQNIAKKIAKNELANKRS